MEKRTAKNGARRDNHQAMTGNKLPQHKKKAFLTAYAQLGTITHAARATKIDRSCHYRWIKDPSYVEAFEVAEAQAIDTLEGEAWRRAVEGNKKPVFHQGMKVGEVTDYSDVLLIFLLKGRFPERYKDNYEFNLNAPTAVQINFSHKKEESPGARPGADGWKVRLGDSRR